MGKKASLVSRTLYFLDYYEKCHQYQKSNLTINLKEEKVIKKKSAVDFFSNCGAYYEIIMSIIDLISLFLFSFSLN